MHAIFTPSRNKPFTELHSNNPLDFDSSVVKGEKYLLSSVNTEHSSGVEAVFLLCAYAQKEVCNPSQKYHPNVSSISLFFNSADADRGKGRTDSLKMEATWWVPTLYVWLNLSLTQYLPSLDICPSSFKLP